VDALQPDDPSRVSQYRLLRRLGTGGMGRVYLGESPGGHLVAVKLIRPELADDPGFRQRFAREVSTARRVSGAFTAPVVDADPDGPRPWLVTVYVEGPSLADAVEERGAMPLDSLLILAAGLAEGLGAVHRAGIIHRDLKPSNVLLAQDGPRIIDFGISRAADSAWLTNGSGVVGSPGFMSPEQAEGGTAGPATDIFSLGGVLAYAATGRAPFGAGSASALLYRVVYGTAATAQVPPQLRGLVESCLAKNPADRPDAEWLLAELGRTPSAVPGTPAASTASWRSWQGPVTASPRDTAPTELDSSPSRQAATIPQRAAPRGDAERRRTAVLIAAAAAVLAAGVIAGGAYAVASSHDAPSGLPPANGQIVHATQHLLTPASDSDSRL
jgi:serine/threonine protein kinase